MPASTALNLSPGPAGSRPSARQSGDARIRPERSRPARAAREQTTPDPAGGSGSEPTGRALTHPGAVGRNGPERGRRTRHALDQPNAAQSRRAVGGVGSRQRAGILSTRHLGRFSGLLLLAMLLAPGLTGPALAAPAPTAPPVAAAAVPTVLHGGPCNASTALTVGAGLFVVADDEAKPPVTLRLYRSGLAGAPVGEGTIPARAVAPVNDGHPELDLEASARIGPLAYWIGSHGAAGGHGQDGGGKSGKGEAPVGEPRPNRQRLFATTLGLRASDDGKTISLTVEPVGRPYTTLIADLAADPRYAPFQLDAAARRPGKAKGGLSIEGLAATPSGGLLIGFRNPVPDRKALLVPLTNPNAVMAGEKAQFGDPVLLDLGGLGIRSLERVNGRLLIAAGPAEGSKGKATPSALYRWSGQFESPAVRVRGFEAVSGGTFNPEALLIDGDSLVVLSDDGKLERDGRACQELPPAKQGFRELRISPIP